MKIGDKTYNPSRPDDLDEQLIASTGINAAETARNLAGHPIASQVAAAVRPFLPKSAPSVPELASAIAADDLDRIRGEVVELYAAKVPAAAPAKAS
jgi:hypothetical protein